jgi:hypothetical protein
MWLTSTNILATSDILDYTWKFMCLHGLYGFIWMIQNNHQLFDAEYNMLHMIDLGQRWYQYNVDMDYVTSFVIEIGHQCYFILPHGIKCMKNILKMIFETLK